MPLAQIAKKNLPPDQARGIPGYPIGAIRIGRLASDLSFRGQGVAKILLRDCLSRIVLLARSAESPAFRFIIVDAKNDVAIKIYHSFGFILLPDNCQTLVLPVETVLSSF